MAATQHVRLIQLFAIAIHHAVLKMNAVTGQTDNALHDIEPGLRRRNEDKDIAVTRLAIRNEFADPFRRRRQQNSADEDVVADQQGVLHRTGRDGESLQSEGNNEETRHQDDGDGSNKFGSCFFRPFRF